MSLAWAACERDELGKPSPYRDCSKFQKVGCVSPLIPCLHPTSIAQHRSCRQAIILYPPRRSLSRHVHDAATSCWRFLCRCQQATTLSRPCPISSANPRPTATKISSFACSKTRFRRPRAKIAVHADARRCGVFHLLHISAPPYVHLQPSGLTNTQSECVLKVCLEPSDRCHLDLRQAKPCIPGASRRIPEKLQPAAGQQGSGSGSRQIG